MATRMERTNLVSILRSHVMSTHKRCIDDVGLVHYANYAGVKDPVKKEPRWSPWCNPGKHYETAAKRALVTCLLCLRERSKRGGPGSLLPYVG